MPFWNWCAMYFRCLGPGQNDCVDSSRTVAGWASPSSGDLLHSTLSLWHCFVLQVAGDSDSAECYIRGAGRILSVCVQCSVSQKCCHPAKARHEEIPAERRGVCSKLQNKMRLIIRKNCINVLWMFLEFRTIGSRRKRCESSRSYSERLRTAEDQTSRLWSVWHSAQGT